MRRWKLVLALVAGLLVVAAGSGVVVFKVTHRRDEAGYLRYMAEYGDIHGRTIQHLPDANVLAGAGDEACHWLAGQAIAGWRTSQDFRFGSVMDRYLQETAGTPLPWPGAPQRVSVADGAWHYLCPGLWAVHKPHFIFTSSHPGD